MINVPVEFFMLQNYLLYLSFINGKLEKFFNRQKPYIMCEKGCGKCCKNAQFPFSKIEFDFLLAGVCRLPEETKQIIWNNIAKVLEQRENFKGKKFLYDCPFLINDVCSVYPYRGIVCRTFGLMSKGADGRIKVPFCCFEGYNYSNVIDLETRKISAKGFEEEPLGFNISYEFLTDPDFEKGFKFEFGEKKPLIEWFIKQ